MSIEHDTRVSTSLHPLNITKIDGYGEATKGYAAGAERALHEAYSGISSVFAARKAAQRDLSLTDTARVIKIDDLAQRVFKKVATIFDRESANLSKGIAQLEEKLNAPVNARAAHPIAAEVRAHVRAMKGQDRTGFVMRAINSGDATTAESVLGAPSYLSGLSAEAQTVLLRMYHDHAAPEEAAKLKTMQGAFALLGSRGGLLFTQLEQAVGANPQAVRKMREAKARSDKAFAV